MFIKTKLTGWVLCDSRKKQVKLSQISSQMTLLALKAIQNKAAESNKSAR